MSARVQFKGLDELRASLRRLPQEMRDEAFVLIIRTGDAASEEIRAAYEAAKVSGNLARGVRVEPLPSTGRFGAAVRVKSTAKHAFLYENGTQTRKTNLGANRGAAPPGRVFVPIMQRRRRQMHELLVDIVRRAGFEVRNAAA